MDIPDKVISRLSLYHFILEDYEGDYISSIKIAELLNIDNSQVRKDIKYLNNSGKCRVGYDVLQLKKSIETTLGFSEQRNAFIVGSGNLGSALAKYDSFLNYGLKIIAMFDTDPIKIGNKINDKEVFNLKTLPEMVKNTATDIAILTVPKEFAKDTANYLTKSGIKYIWNFTRSILNVPSDVKVWNENLIGSFLRFTKNNNVEHK